MRTEEGHRPLTHAQPGVRVAPGRLTPLLLVLCAAGAAGCRPEPASPAAALRATETVIGRALWQGQDMLLTDAPALVAIDRATGAIAYTAIEVPSPSTFAPWGLAEADGELFTISEFVRLMRVTPDGSIAEVATLERPVANLIDLPGGMAAQLSSEPDGTPLVVALGGSGRMSALESPARVDLGLAPAEESLLHLLACSTPPRVVCWLPHDSRLLVFDNAALAEAAVLEGLEPIPAATFISRLDRRVITDAVAADDGRFVVLHEGPTGSTQQITTFDPRGSRLTSVPAPEPLRMLVASEGDEVLVIGRNGQASRVQRP